MVQVAQVDLSKVATPPVEKAAIVERQKLADAIAKDGPTAENVKKLAKAQFNFEWDTKYLEAAPNGLGKLHNQIRDKLRAAKILPGPEYIEEMKYGNKFVAGENKLSPETIKPTDQWRTAALKKSTALAAEAKKLLDGGKADEATTKYVEALKALAKPEKKAEKPQNSDMGSLSLPKTGNLA